MKPGLKVDSPLRQPVFRRIAHVSVILGSGCPEPLKGPLTRASAHPSLPVLPSRSLVYPRVATTAPCTGHLSAEALALPEEPWGPQHQQRGPSPFTEPDTGPATPTTTRPSEAGDPASLTKNIGGSCAEGRAGDCAQQRGSE